MKLQKLFIVLSVLIGFSTTAHSAICTALGNGNWSNPAIWSCGSVPGCGDIIFVPAGVTVNVDMQVDLDENSSPACSTATFIQISGTLQFVTGNKMSLACGSGVVVMPGGNMVPGGGGGSSNWLKICDVELWKTSDGPVPGFKLFGSPLPMPVEFLEFTVKKSSTMVDLEWIVSSERDNDYFSVLYSYNGNDFLKLVDILSIGDHVDSYKYHISQEINFGSSEIVYFRLIQTDKNGSVNILETKSLDLIPEGVLVYPNPTKQGENIFIKIGSSEQISSTIYIYNSLGQLVSEQLLSLVQGTSVTVLKTDDLKRGMYLIKIPSISQEEFYRLIIE